MRTRDPVFVDSSAWFDAHVKSAQRHEKALAWLKQNRRPLLTTDLIVAETLTLLRAREEYRVALRVGEQLWKGELARVYYLTKADLLESWRVFRDYSDKEWSFVDCASKIVMAKLQIETAFAFDHHFTQFGSVEVVPAD